MPTKLFGAVLFLAILMGFVRDASAQQSTKAESGKFRWPNGTAAAVSLTYDDGTLSQYNAGGAADQLKAAGLRGTFFIVKDSMIGNNLVPTWQNVFRMGHEIGSHSATHPCNGDPGISHHFNKPQMIAELDGVVGFLRSVTGTAGPFTHAYPCGEVRDNVPYYMNMMFTNDPHSLVPEVKARFFAARATVPSTPLVPDDTTIADDILYTVPAPCVDTTSSQAIQFIERAKKKNGWIVLCMHEIDNGEHQKLLQYLIARLKDYCVDTFGNLAKYISDRLQNHSTDQNLCPLSKH